MENIHPIFDRIVSRAEFEARLQQRGAVIWFTGLSGAGKSTIAERLERRLFEEGRLVRLLDGDNVRTGLCNNLTFSESDRTENIRRIAEVAKLYVQTGVVVLACFISPLAAHRELARQIVGNQDFVEVYVKADLEVCEQRDVKGLYQKARAGLIPNFTGISEPYEVPANPDLVIDTAACSIETALEQAYACAVGRIRY